MHDSYLKKFVSYKLNFSAFMGTPCTADWPVFHRAHRENPVCDKSNLVNINNRRLVGKNKRSKRIQRSKFKKNLAVINSNVVINLSSYPLTVSELSLINKGLGFVPSHFKPKLDQLNKDFLRFERKLQLFYFFKQKNNEDAGPYRRGILEGNSTWWPKKLNAHITKMCHDIKEECYKSLTKSKIKPNLTKDEISALQSLKNNKKIIIKKCDKGGGIAVMDSDSYLNKVTEMVSDAKTYRNTNVDDSIEVKQSCDTLISNLGSQGLLNKKQLQYLTNFEPRCPLFYGLPKVHKPNIPLRPICSQIEGPTSRLNELVDKYLTVAEQSIPFLLQDTTAYLLLIEQNKHVSPNTILCTVDVTSLYTNIPHEEGAQWVADFYEETLPLWNGQCNGLCPIDKLTLYNYMLFILRNCTFEFNARQYTQLYGTTMGAKFSVKFANIYMHCWLRKFIGLYEGCKPNFIARLIDDCFWLWDYGMEALNEFLNYLNNCHNSIKFEPNCSTEKVNFLDTVTFISNQVIHTNVYTKPTDKKQYLHFESSHPKHTMIAIPYSQAIRYRRIIDEDNLFFEELEVLYSRLRNRGYPDDLLLKTDNKIKLLTRTDVLQYKSKTAKEAALNTFLRGKSFLPCIIPFHSDFQANLKNNINKHWRTMLYSNSKLFDVFQEEFPQIIFKRGVTLGNILVSSKFKQEWDTIDLETIETLQALIELNQAIAIESVTPCGALRCKCCAHIVQTSKFHDTSRKFSFAIAGNFDCNSKNFIYVISCFKCKMLYVGQSGLQLRERLNNHRSDIKTLKNTAVSLHFNSPNHSIADLRITPIFTLQDLSFEERGKIEFQYMKTLNTIYPSGMNHYPLLCNT
jgi:hypothetical protein